MSRVNPTISVQNSLENALNPTKVRTVRKNIGTIHKNVESVRKKMRNKIRKNLSQVGTEFGPGGNIPSTWDELVSDTTLNAGKY